MKEACNELDFDFDFEEEQRKKKKKKYNGESREGSPDFDSGSELESKHQPKPFSFIGADGPVKVMQIGYGGGIRYDIPERTDPIWKEWRAQQTKKIGVSTVRHVVTI